MQDQDDVTERFARAVSECMFDAVKQRAKTSAIIANQYNRGILANRAHGTVAENLQSVTACAGLARGMGGSLLLSTEGKLPATNGSDQAVKSFAEPRSSTGMSKRIRIPCKAS